MRRLKSLIKKENILIIFAGLELIILILQWFGVKPVENSKNVLIGWYKMLFIKIPLIVPLFIFTIWVILIIIRQKNKVAGSTKVIPKVNNKDVSSVTKEQAFILLTLLNKPNRSSTKEELRVLYEMEFKKFTADFNILRQELLDKSFIWEAKTGYGYSWHLMNEGLRVASEVYKKIKAENIHE